MTTTEYPMTTQQVDIRFTKMHGAGNDFILIDNREQQCRLNPGSRRLMCDRRLGVGADGLMEIETSQRADFRLVYFNSDGNLGSLCGNGSRCAVVFAWINGIRKNTAQNTMKRDVKESSNIPRYNDQIGKTTQDGRTCGEQDGFNDCETFTFEASDGLHVGGIWQSLMSAGRGPSEFWVSVDIRDVALSQLREYGNGDFFVNTGSPHHVTFLREDSSAIFDVVSTGRQMRNELYGSEGSNINFVFLADTNLTQTGNTEWDTSVLEEYIQKIKTVTDISKRVKNNAGDFAQLSPGVFQASDDLVLNDCEMSDQRPSPKFNEPPQTQTNNRHLCVRTYERGVEDGTLACGTGCVAVAIADFVKCVQKCSGRVNCKDGEDWTMSTTQVSDSALAPGVQRVARTIHTRGGVLRVTFTVSSVTDSSSSPSGAVKFTDIILSGPVCHVFDGSYRLSYISVH